MDVLIYILETKGYKQILLSKKTTTLFRADIFQT